MMNNVRRVGKADDLPPAAECVTLVRERQALLDLLLSVRFGGDGTLQLHGVYAGQLETVQVAETDEVAWTGPAPWPQVEDRWVRP